MKHMTISAGFLQAIDGRPVTRAFFSTYCLEPDFFELDVLPLLLGSPALSSAEPLRYQQLQALMGASAGCFGVAYDAPVFTPTLASRLEVDYLPLQVDGACHHAKLALVEVAGKDGPALIVCAGSFNLTRAGWWENIEVGHWVELSAADAPSNLVAPLRAALDWYLEQGRLPVLEALAALLARWTPTRPRRGCEFYFSRPHQGDFTQRLAQFSDGALEIVSPYFAEDHDNARLAAFLRGFKGGVSMLLPRDARQAATVTEAFHAGLGKLLRWCDWHAKSRKAFGLADAANPDERGYRKLHAKIYGGNDWLFVGSVNFSHQAMFANVEAGFLLGGLDRGPLLGKDSTAERFADALALEAPAPQAGALAFPPVFLAYDWHAGRLEASCRKHGALVLHGREGEELLRLALAGETAWVDAPALREQLRHSSLVRARWQEGDALSAARDVMVTQRQVYCRPSILPPLSLQDVLRILQDMHPASRAAAFGKLMARLQHLGGAADDSLEFLPPLPEAAAESTFFAEFSQVNGAFWHLKKRLCERPAELAYYLDGDQPDSLRGILRALDEAAPQAESTPVVRYLTLLGMDELLAANARGDVPLAAAVRARIAALEDSPAFGAIADKEKFLAWIKRIFVLPVPSSPDRHAQS